MRRPRKSSAPPRPPFRLPDWMGLVELAKGLATMAQAGSVQPDALTRLRRLVFAAGSDAIPVGAGTREPARRALLAACEGFVISEGESRWARVLHACAVVVEGQIEETRRRSADVWRRQSGGDL